jgi:dihydropyrimidinase
MAITDFGPNTPAEMREVVEKHGITSFKVFMAYKGALMVDDGQLYQIMREAAKLGAVVTVHAENGDAVWHLQKELLAKGCTGPEFHPVSRPSLVEGEATGRALAMARLHGATAYIVHMTCKEAVHALERAKLAGQRCYGETCPQYLLLDDTVFDKPDFGGSAYVMSPPIRPGHVGHHDALWSGLTNRMLDSVGTDHCPFTHEQKKMGLGDFTKIPNGAAGIEDRLLLLHTYGVLGGHFGLSRMVELGSTAPARIFGLAKKGSIAVGMDADVVLFDPSGERALSAKTHHSKADRSVFEGFKVRGRVARTIANGRTVWDGKQLTTSRGAGRFVARRPSHFSQNPEVKP